VFDGSSFQLLHTIPYRDDADNVRYDSREDRFYVGYGSGALGVTDKDGNKIADIKLDAHPESFQLETTGSRIFVNLPKSNYQTSRPLCESDILFNTSCRRRSP
jgi:hypothetical protein